MAFFDCFNWLVDFFFLWICCFIDDIFVKTLPITKKKSFFFCTLWMTSEKMKLAGWSCLQYKCVVSSLESWNSLLWSGNLFTFFFIHLLIILVTVVVRLCVCRNDFRLLLDAIVASTMLLYVLWLCKHSIRWLVVCCQAESFSNELLLRTTHANTHTHTTLSCSTIVQCINLP